MTLVRRFLLAFGSVIALVGGAYSYVIYSFDAMEYRTREEARIADTIAAANHLDASALKVILLLEQFADSGDPELLKDFYAQRAASAEGRQRLRQLGRRSDVLEYMDVYEALLPARITAADRVIEAVQSGASQPEIVALKRERQRLDPEALAYPSRIVELEHRALAEAHETTSAVRRRIVRNVTGLATSTLLLAVGLSVWLSWDISRRLEPLIGLAHDVGHADFAARVPVDGSDEIATLGTAFNQMVTELERFDKVKDEFVALASHQLRTPATAVKGNVSMLLDGYHGEMTDEQQEILRDAYAANDRQLEIIEDILNVARVESGRLAVSKVTTDVAQLVDHVVAEHRFTIEARDQTIDVVRPHRLECAVDANKLKIVVDNLVSNASKYTPQGGKIDVRLAMHNGYVVLAVQDTGVGIPLPEQGRLFKKFTRIDNELSVEVGGTGLGLYLANEIVKLHGGEILVTSSPSAGSTFSVTLPAA